MDVCRFCSSPLQHVVTDLGLSPLSNALVNSGDLEREDVYYPLRPYVCENCWLVQLPQLETAENIFCEYPYFSSYSTSWLKHVAAYAREMIDAMALSSDSLVVELGSNDGHLLECFQKRDIGVVGVEPAKNVARTAIANGVPTEAVFFGSATSRDLRARYGLADLIVGNNVLAHVPDLNDFIAAMCSLLKPNGIITMEFPHLLRLVERTEFDTIYHEHFCYFSLSVVRRIFQAHNLCIYDVQELTTHGGSLRIFAKHLKDAPSGSPAVISLEEQEVAAGLESPNGYVQFDGRVKTVKDDLLDFLLMASRENRAVAGYGAPAKATTLLNYCGIDRTVLPYTVDRNPHKQGKYIPGVRIPIEPPETIYERNPDYVLVLPWNLAGEIVEQMDAVRGWGAKFVLPIPALTIIS
ncbi:MAG: SAM-dependent methyltransferase [Candidatus Eremiobacter antarcticus]|nr:class I SAM-dependent methyltransferase [Candidatus Eremiobacteraeota bacterium]MBC5808050.1 class I SAM-dependent methyltransferase [Candidatus Eremiobacteraeota bacterium]PZR63810.1 MAG: SAM-dependent methyltransferase [Candidatus Eremiobacter sp. RRmetagenome_bin22]